MRVEYELDQWEWQGTTRSIDVDPQDYRDMSVDEIKQAVYEEIRRDAEHSLHLVYAEDETVREILDALTSSDNEDEE
jgi:hypothetical protein